MIELPWPPSVLNPNVRKHWSAKAKAAKKYKHDCLWMLKAQKPEPMRKFSVLFCPPDNRRRDRDNTIASCKHLQDALATYWGIDDSEFEINYKPYAEPIKGGLVIIERIDNG